MPAFQLPSWPEGVGGLAPCFIQAGIVGVGKPAARKRWQVGMIVAVIVVEAMDDNGGAFHADVL